MTPTPCGSSPGTARSADAFLFEKKYPDAETVVDRLYGEDRGCPEPTVSDKWIR